MQVELILEPGVSMGWEKFCKTKPPFSIAVDGFVHRGPREKISKNGRWINFNHHEEVERLPTRATCGQVYFAIKQGLYEYFNRKILVFANDCDQDVCVSWTLLNNGYREGFISKKMVYKLTMAEDTIDTFAGAYPFPNDFMPMMKKLAWIFEPYTEFRNSGRINEPIKDPLAFKEVVFAVEQRFLKTIEGRGRTRPLDARYERIRCSGGWIVAREIGAHAKTGIFNDGYKVYAVFRQNSALKYFWVFGKLMFAPFDLKKLMSLLNDLEGTPENPQPYGGGNTIFGNRNSAGSSIGPERMANIMAEIERFSLTRIDNQQLSN